MTNQDKPKHLTLVTDSLTGKQESFAQKVAAGAVLSDAYREAYSAENMKDSTVWSEACKLAQHPKVSARVKAIQADIEADHRTRAARREEYVLKRLQEEAEGAETDGARVRALELLGKSVSLFTDRVETDSLSALRLISRLRYSGHWTGWAAIINKDTRPPPLPYPPI